MILRIFLTISPYVSPICVSLENPISREAAEVYDQKTVVVRGFLYSHPSGQLVLSHRPDLKSCCIGSEALNDQQLLVEGEFLPTLTAVDLKGVFYINSFADENEKSQFTPRYLLKNVELTNTSGTRFNYIWLILSGFFFSAYHFLKKNGEMQSRDN